MKPALYYQTSVKIAAGDHNLRVSGSVLKFKGWLEVLGDAAALNSNNKNGNGEAEAEEEAGELPLLGEGDVLKMTGAGISSEQKFTQPPARFTEGTLIRELEERGIGRPSTYATILSIIQDRRYVVKEDGKLVPSEIGNVVTDRLVKHFPRILDPDFTASMEELLDKIEDGTQDWVKLLADFYNPFHDEVKLALKEMKDVRDLTEKSEEVCDRCGKDMLVKWGRNGRFLACSGYPECRNTKEIDPQKNSAVQAEPVDVACHECGKPMVRKRGRYGDFLACSTYPECKATRSMPTGDRLPAQGLRGRAGRAPDPARARLLRL